MNESTISDEKDRRISDNEIHNQHLHHLHPQLHLHIPLPLSPTTHNNLQQQQSMLSHIQSDILNYHIFALVRRQRCFPFLANTQIYI